MKKRIFSGIQPSGNLHIGNYLGAIKNWVKLQDEYESIFCIVDLHAITVPQKPEELKKRTLEIAKTYLASGIDPKKSAIFIQSHIKEHTELAWILNTITKIPELNKMTQFKDKSAKEGTEKSSAGLFNYPVLMASDILLYDAELVPVGEDQLQHIELTRILAKRFNSRFGETFNIPEPFYVQEERMLARRSLGAGGRIMGLDDPAKKMSKSASSEYNYISLLDSPEIIEKKIKKAVTDSGSEIKYSGDKPALKNLISIYASFSGKKPREIEKEYGGKGYADFKSGLTKAVLDFIVPFQERYDSLDDKEVLQILRSGAEKIRPIAEEKIKEVKSKMGIVL